MSSVVSIEGSGLLLGSVFKLERSYKMHEPRKENATWLHDLKLFSLEACLRAVCRLMHAPGPGFSNLPEVSLFS